MTSLELSSFAFAGGKGSGHTSNRSDHLIGGLRLHYTADDYLPTTTITLEEQSS